MTIRMEALLVGSKLPSGRLDLGTARHSETNQLFDVFVVSGEFDERIPGIALGMYEHYKHNFYVVLGCVWHKDEGWLVWYAPRYHRVDETEVAAISSLRPFDMFIENVAPDQPRFLRI